MKFQKCSKKNLALIAAITAAGLASVTLTGTTHQSPQKAPVAKVAPANTGK